MPALVLFTRTTTRGVTAIAGTKRMAAKTSSATCSRASAWTSCTESLISVCQQLMAAEVSDLVGARRERLSHAICRVRPCKRGQGLAILARRPHAKCRPVVESRGSGSRRARCRASVGSPGVVFRNRPLGACCPTLARCQGGERCEIIYGCSGKTVLTLYDEDVPDPLVSVIVPVRDGGQLLDSLLAAFGRQTLPRTQFEVVIADDGSSDPPVALETEDGHIRVLPGPPVNSYSARNRGVAASRGKILAFCDADCIPEPDWLEEGMAGLRYADVCAGRFRFLVPEDRTVWTLIDMDSSKNHEHLVTRGLAETANLFMRREVFERIGGFDASVSEHGDFDLVERLIASGASLRYSESAVCWHPARKTGHSVLRAHWIYCRGYAERSRNAPDAGRRAEASKLGPCDPDITWTAEGRAQANGCDVLAGRKRCASTWSEQIYSLPLMYLLLPYWRNLAQLVGAIDGRRRRAEPVRARIK